MTTYTRSPSIDPGLQFVDPRNGRLTKHGFLIAQSGLPDTEATLTRKTIGDFLTFAERSSDPADPEDGSFCIWLSDGTGAGDDGDVMVKLTVAGVTKTTTLIDYSTLP